MIINSKSSLGDLINKVCRNLIMINRIKQEAKDHHNPILILMIKKHKTAHLGLHP